MTISELLNNFCSMMTQSETEVRTKFVNPLCELLGYPIENRAEEFPVYGFEGGKPINCKPADILFFSSNEFVNNRTRKESERKWVYKNSLLLIEIKKRGEDINVEGQAIYYAAWTRTPLYIVTNGEGIRFYKINSLFEDQMIKECKIKDIQLYWDIIYDSFSYNCAIELKKLAAVANDNVINERYFDYCNNLIVNLDRTLKHMLNRQVSPITTYGFETKIHDEKYKQIEYQNIFSDKKSAIIVSEPGGGKSYLISMIARHSLVQLSQENKIPVIIYCGYFSITFHDIATAIYNEITPFCPNITKEIIENDIRAGRYMLLFDALDEVRNNKNILINQIKTLITSTENKVAVTERQENHNNDFAVISEKYSIIPLNEEFIALYIKNNTKNQLNYYGLNLDKRFQTLLSRPLFLFIFVEILNNQFSESYSIPQNTSLLFDGFFKQPLRQKQLTNAEIRFMELILAQYAEWLMYNQESDIKLLEYIKDAVGSANSEKYMEFISRSGIMIEGLNGFKFFHYTFLEYFFAKKIIQNNNEVIISFLDQHANDPRYIEIICFMVGIISDSNRQNVVLDYLQKTNLSLFIKALKSRFKFDNSMVNGYYDYSREYFTQIRNSYLEIIDTYFSKIKHFFYPFSTNFDNQTEKLKLVGEIDTVDYGININLICVKKEDPDVEFSSLISRPQMYVGNDRRATPILSMSNNQGGYYYDLLGLSLGADSAREIAVNMIQDQLFKLIKEKTVFDLNISVLMVECIEDTIQYIRKYHKLPKELVDLSLANDPKKVLDFLFMNREKPPIYSIGFKGPKISFELLYIYCYLLINSGEILSTMVLPKDDLTYASLEGKKPLSFSDFYSDEQMVKRVKSVIELVNIGYKSLISHYFFELKSQMKNASDTNYQFIRISRSEKSWGICKTIIQTTEKNQGIEVRLVDEIPNSIDPDDEEKYVLEKLGCTRNDITSKSQGGLHDYFVENVLHSFIYKQLESDFNLIFKGKR